MNEGIFPQQTGAPTPPPANQTAQPSAKPSYKTNNWIALIFVVIAVVIVFNKNPGLADILFWVMLCMGIVGGISFIERMLKLNKSVSNVAARAFLLLVGIAGGIVIFIIGFFAAMIGYFNAHPLHGD